MHRGEDVKTRRSASGGGSVFRGDSRNGSHMMMRQTQWPTSLIVWMRRGVPERVASLQDELRCPTISHLRSRGQKSSRPCWMRSASWRRSSTCCEAIGAWPGLGPAWVVPATRVFSSSFSLESRYVASLFNCLFSESRRRACTLPICRFPSTRSESAKT